LPVSSSKANTGIGNQKKALVYDIGQTTLCADCGNFFGSHKCCHNKKKVNKTL